jgi:hypothetical protein
MPTLGAAITAIRGDLNRSTDFDARIQEAIVNAIRFYRARRYGFNVKRSTIELAGEYTSLSTDFIEIDYAKLEVGATLKPLVERTYTWLNDTAQDASLSSEPIWFAVQERQLRVYPPPDDSYSTQIHYLYDLTGISLSTSDTTTSNAWLDEGYEVIRLHAMAEVLEMHIGGPEAFETAARLRTREDQAEKELKRRANREQSSGQVKGVM